MAAPNLLTFSYATYGPSGGETPAATYLFYSQDYQPPRRRRAITVDEVHNHRGHFKYIFDNGPAGVAWNPFTLVLGDKFEGWVGSKATQQLANLDALWNHTGIKGFSGPDGTYEVYFPNQDLDVQFETFPMNAGDKMEFRAIVAIEEG